MFFIKVKKHVFMFFFNLQINVFNIYAFLLLLKAVSKRCFTTVTNKSISISIDGKKLY